MLVQLTLFITLILYAALASQAFMYILSLKTVQLKLDAPAYIKLRQLIDAAMMASIKYVMYAAMLFNTLLVVLLIKTHGLLFCTALFSAIMLVIDIVITLKGNLPINPVINTWSTENYPSNWFEYRDRWLRFFRYRQIVIIAGFIGLVVGVVF